MTKLCASLGGRTRFRFRGMTLWRTARRGSPNFPAVAARLKRSSGVRMGVRPSRLRSNLHTGRLINRFAIEFDSSRRHQRSVWCPRYSGNDLTIIRVNVGTASLLAELRGWRIGFKSCPVPEPCPSGSFRVSGRCPAVPESLA